MRTVTLTLTALLLITTNLPAGNADTIFFSADSLIIDNFNRTIGYQQLETITEENRPSVPALKRLYLAGPGSCQTNPVYIVHRADTLSLGFTPSLSPPDLTTSSDDAAPRQIPFLKRIAGIYPSTPIHISANKLNGRSINTLTIFPIQYLGSDTIILNREIVITMENRSPLESSANMIPPTESSISTASVNSYQNGCPLGQEVVIITSPDLAPEFSDYLNLKRRTGFDADLAITDSIYVYYGGFDRAETVRNYLKEFHHAGGRYVILGGDEDHVPIRYAYYYNTTTPQSLDHQMICDLYFADLDGDWDYDGDGVFGEPTEDHPDLGAELLVGRLPFSQPGEVSAYTAKVETYIFDPGQGNRDYLARSLFFTSDQMRDYFEDGQQYKVAEKFPVGFSTDCESLAESPTGDDPAPDNPTGNVAITTMNHGYGIINILAHGRPDGFVLNASAYNEYPKQYLFTGNDHAGHAVFSELDRSGASGFYYSISCDQGAIDLESVYGMNAVSVVRELLSLDSAGAIGMVAFSRWGWVASSYKLMVAFYDHLFDDARGFPASAMYLSYLDYPYYRDQIYGQNFYGDPSLSVYTALPEQLIIEAPDYYFSGETIHGRLLKSGTGLPGRTVTVMMNDEYYGRLSTDPDGNFILDVDEDCTDNISLCAYLPEAVAASVNLLPSIIADAGDDENSIPTEFALRQNYPNPFNPSTAIRFAITRSSNIKIAISNIMGQLVDIVADDFFTAGEHEIIWDGQDHFGTAVASGIYFYQLYSEEGLLTRKMCLIR